MRNPLQQMVLRTYETDSQAIDTRITSRLNVKASPLGGDYGHVRSSGKQNHQGWDLASRPGTPVFAIASGSIEWIRFYTGNVTHDPYGNQVCLRTTIAQPFLEQPLWAFYAHLMTICVQQRQPVREGDVLGFVGSTGNADKTPAHLHFELRTSGARHLPKGLLYRINPGQVLGYSYYRCG
jgi:murein DD-endopeptidase MepM/ murein hydrolase activator NlpD